MASGLELAWMPPPSPCLTSRMPSSLMALATFRRGSLGTTTVVLHFPRVCKLSPIRWLMVAGQLDLPDPSRDRLRIITLLTLPLPQQFPSSLPVGQALTLPTMVQNSEVGLPCTWPVWIPPHASATQA